MSDFTDLSSSFVVARSSFIVRSSSSSLLCWQLATDVRRSSFGVGRWAFGVRRHSSLSSFVTVVVVVVVARRRRQGAIGWVNRRWFGCSPRSQLTVPLSRRNVESRRSDVSSSFVVVVSRFCCVCCRCTVVLALYRRIVVENSYHRLSVVSSWQFPWALSCRDCCTTWDC